MSEHVQEQALRWITTHHEPLSLPELYERCDLAENQGEVAVALNALARDGRIDVMRCKDTGRRLFGALGQSEALPAAAAEQPAESRPQPARHPKARASKLISEYLQQLGRGATTREIAEGLGEPERQHAIGCTLSLMKKAGQVAARPAGRGPAKLFTWVGDGAPVAAVATPVIKAPAMADPEPTPAPPPESADDELSCCAWDDGRVELYRAGSLIDTLSLHEAQRLARFLAIHKPALRAPGVSHDH